MPRWALACVARATGTDGLRECERAIQLSPGYFLAHDWLAIPLSSLGRFDEALAAIGRAKSLEPLSLVVHHHEAWVNVMAGRFGDAARAAGQALELDANYSFGWWWLGIAQTELGQTGGSRSKSGAGSSHLRRFPIGPFGARARLRAGGTAGRGFGLHAGADEIGSPVRGPVPHGTGARGARAVERGNRLPIEASDANSTWLRIYGPHDPRLNVLRGEPRLENLLRKSASGSGINEKQT